MGNRRISRKRLFALNKLGQSSTNTAGPGIAPAVVSNTVIREGHKIITEVTLDLGTSKATIAAANDEDDVIGIDGVEGAYICQLTPAVNGYITYVEMACLEVPTSATNAQTDIDLRMTNNAARKYDDDGNSYTSLIAAGGTWALGEVDHYAVTLGTALDIGADDLYVYLTCGAAQGGGDMTGGKYVITFEGYAVPDDK